jgi:predicted metalloendopeptidase
MTLSYIIPTKLTYIYTDLHPPISARANDIALNNTGFAKAFDCHVGNPMNP